MVALRFKGLGSGDRNKVLYSLRIGVAGYLLHGFRLDSMWSPALMQHLSTRTTCLGYEGSKVWAKMDGSGFKGL